MKPLGIHDLGVVVGQAPRRPDISHRALADEKVAGPIQVRARVEEMSAADQEVGGRRDRALEDGAVSRHAGCGSGAGVTCGRPRAGFSMPESSS